MRCRSSRVLTRLSAVVFDFHIHPTLAGTAIGNLHITPAITTDRPLPVRSEVRMGEECRWAAERSHVFLAEHALALVDDAAGSYLPPGPVYPPMEKP